MTRTGGRRRWGGAGLLVLAAAVPAIALRTPARAAEPEDHSGLTRDGYRRNCLLCHAQAAPEGISPEIMAGLTPVPGLRPAAAMPGILCQRRCEACKRAPEG